MEGQNASVPNKALNSETSMSGAGVAPPSSKTVRIRVTDAVKDGHVFEAILKAAQLIAEAAFFMSVGAIMMAWDGIGKLVRSARHKGGLGSFDLAAGFTPQPRPMKVKVPILPIDNYTGLTASEVIKGLERLAPEQLRLVRDFEIDNKNRKTIVEAIDRVLARGAP
jgi:hypothetical protein